MQKPDAPEEFADILTTNFPATGRDTAAQLADLIGEEAYAQQNVLGILQEIKAPVTTETLELVINQIESGLSAYDIHDPDNGESPPDPLPYHEEDGFPKFRSRLIIIACSLLPEKGLEKTIQTLEGMDSWITLQDDMGLDHEADSLEEFRSIQDRWRRNVIEGRDTGDAAALLKCPQNQLASWSHAVKSKNLGRHTIRAIHGELELAQAAAALDPNFWRRYAGECRRNRALPLRITANRGGNTIGLALLRFRKGRWYTAVPTSHGVIRLDLDNHDHLHRELQKFGREYNQAATRTRTKK